MALRLPARYVPERKVSAYGSVGTLTGLLAWVLVTMVPAFHHGLPDPVANALPWAAGLILGFAAAWRAPHTPRGKIVIRSSPPQDRQ